MPRVRIKLLGIIADEMGIDELIIDAKNLLELLNKLRVSLPKAEKIFEDNNLRSFIGIVLNNTHINSKDKDFTTIELKDNDVVELIPLASGG